jgi:PAS domain-containing protein
MLFLALVRTAHFWTEVHPELAFEPDLEAMLREHEAIAEPLLRSADEAARWELGRRLYDEMQSLRESQKNIEALRDSEARFRATFENAAVGIARVTPDGRWLEVNQRFCDIALQSRLVSAIFRSANNIEYIAEPVDLVARMRQTDRPRVYSPQPDGLEASRCRAENVVLGMISDEPGIAFCTAKFVQASFENPGIRFLEADDL